MSETATNALTEPVQASPFDADELARQVRTVVRLQQAAPDMLAALKAVVSLFEYRGEDAAGFAWAVEIEVRAAIAKAEGRA